VSAAHGLAGVLAAFVAILATVMWASFRERRAVRQVTADARAGDASDARILVAIFLAIPGGMLLTLVSAWLVFF
jgi:predicted anti-sigma-YlaC factor YlaD